jgi:hypothetical protein
MAIIAPQTAPNFSTGNYHRILKVEVICNPRELVPRYHILVGFYASAEARDINSDPMYVNAVDIPFTDGVEDPRAGIYALLMQTPLFAGTNAESDVGTEPPEEIPEPEPVAPEEVPLP